MNNNCLIFRTFIVPVLMAGLLLQGAPAWAKSPINTDWWGVAVKGYDPVAYFTLSKPVKGSKKYQYEWMQVTWRFSSGTHRDLFIADPQRYAPRYGGY